jgi:pimeloyl-ACP methyl ester carboxylesterase
MNETLKARATGRYALVNGLNMYYEIHGEGQPLVLLHGGFMVIEAMEPLLSLLAQSSQVIAVELEGHGRTADLDRPLSTEQMAHDVAGLIEQLGLAQTDVLGFSLGGRVALRLTIQRPDLVRKLVVISAGYSNDGFYPMTMVGWPSLSHEALAGTPMEQAYAQTAPDPSRWPSFVGKIREALMSFKGWSPEEIRAIKVPTLLVLGDADFIRPEYAVEMFRLLGGAPEHGGMGELPQSQLAVLPGTTHFNILDRTDLLLPIVTPFLQRVNTNFG